MTHEVVGSCQGETRMPEHIGISPAEEGWTVANDIETCLVVALNCNVLQHTEVNWVSRSLLAPLRGGAIPRLNDPWEAAIDWGSPPCTHMGKHRMGKRRSCSSFSPHMHNLP
jgi:hypothetical protein